MTAVTTSVSVRGLQDGEDARWDAFVLSHPDATFFHRIGWLRAVESGFGHAIHPLIAERGGAIVGVLPLVHVTHPIFGSSLVSSAFAVHGGPLAVEAEAGVRLDASAIALAQRLGVGHLEYRGKPADGEGWLVRDDVYASFRRPLDADPEKNLTAIPRKQRAVVRHSLENGLEARLGEDVAVNWRLYATSVRNLGTPVLPRRFFAALKRQFGADCEILDIYKDGRPIAGCLTFYFRDEVLPYYAGGVPEARQFGAHDFMYWNITCRAAERGSRLFDFGRSKAGTGPYAFKKNWGFKPTPLTYAYRPVRVAEIPEHNPLNPKYRLFIEAWKRLPLGVANLIGPWLVRGLP